MNIKQLRDYYDRLLASGVDPFTPVCVPDVDGQPMEATDINLMAGPWREDSSPKLSAPILSHGQFLFLGTMDEYPWKQRNEHTRVAAPEAPAKEYRPGTEWWLRLQG